MAAKEEYRVLKLDYEKKASCLTERKRKIWVESNQVGKDSTLLCDCFDAEASPKFSTLLLYLQQRFTELKSHVKKLQVPSAALRKLRRF
jgi:hypothetical protein